MFSRRDVVGLDLDRVGDLVRAVEHDRVAIDAADRDPGLVLGHDDAAGVEPGADEDDVAGLRRRDRRLDGREAVGHADQVGPPSAPRPGRTAGSSSVPTTSAARTAQERTAGHPASYAAHARFVPSAIGARRAASSARRACARWTRSCPPSIRNIRSKLSGPRSRCRADPLPVRVARAAPQVDVRRPERLELGEELERVVIVACAAGRPTGPGRSR